MMPRPAALALWAGAIVGAIPALILTVFVYELWIVPRAEREAATAADTALRLEIQLATHDEIARQHASVRAALASLDLALSETEKQRDALLAGLEQEIARYERERETQGRSCRLSGPDIDWLRGL